MRAIITAMLLFSDALGAAAAFRLTYFIRYESGIFVNPLPAEIGLPMAALTVYWWVVIAMHGMYRTPVALSRFDEMSRCFRATVVGTLIIFFVTFDASKPVDVTRIFLVNYGLILFMCITLGRTLIRTFQRRLRSRGKCLWNAVIVGDTAVGDRLYRQLHYYPVWGFIVRGFIRLNGDATGQSDWKILGGIEDLPEVIRANRIEWIFVAPDSQTYETLLRVFDVCILQNVRFMIVANYYQMVVGLVRTVGIHGLPLVEVTPQLVPLFVRIIKRAFDIVASLFVLAVLAVLMPVIVLIIKLDSPGPVFYRQERVGRGGRRFKLVKFRSMVRDAEKQSGAVWAARNDPRITRVGRLLRKFYIDELPQFFNVVKGEMSVVGPRPERPMFVEQFKSRIPLYERRLRLRPGITGWAQVRHKYDETLDDVRDKTRYDLFYIDRLSLVLDLKIIIFTILQVLRAGGH